MKYTPTKIYALLAALTFSCQVLLAQTILGGSDLDPSAVMELRSNDKGLLLPRLSLEQRDAIANPAKGLVLFNTTLNCVDINIGTPSQPSWKCLFYSAQPGLINSLNCAEAEHLGSLTAGVAATGVQTNLVYSGGNGQTFSGLAVTSTGVTGLTATLAGGNLANGNGTLSWSISGVPSGTGTASFEFTFGGQNCIFTRMVSSGQASSLQCGNAIHSGTLIAGVPASNAMTNMPYTGGNGGPYPSQAIISTGVTGLTATLAPGQFAQAGGLLQWTITGTPSGSGTATFEAQIGGQSCQFSRSVSPGSIQNLQCGTATHLGTLTAGLMASGVSSVVSYTGGNGGLYAMQSVNSTGVSGLTAHLAAGSFVQGAGTLTFTITGTPSGSGTASFAIQVGGQSCILSRTVTGGAIQSLQCTEATHSGSLVVGVPANSVFSQVPYTGGTGGPHQGQSVGSVGVTGLTATVASGNFAIGAGNLIYNITGTPSNTGTATFALQIGGQSCTLSRTVISGAISSLNCQNASVVGTLVPGVAATGASLILPYSGGNGGPYGDYSATSQGVTGLTATLPAGAFASGDGALNLALSGTPSGIGAANFLFNIGGQACSLAVQVVGGSIVTLNCQSAQNLGSLTVGTAAMGVSSNIPYTGGNGGIHPGQTVGSTGVTGLIATLTPGSFQQGAGILSYQITGTPSSGGVATFLLNIGGRECSLSRTVGSTAPNGTISALICSGATHAGMLSAGTPANGVSSTVPYTGGNGGAHSGQTVNSTGVTGLTATLIEGNFSSGAGTLVYTITGTPSASGTATFAFQIGGRTCTLTRFVAANGVNSCGAYIAAGVWRNFQCHNLGANPMADPFTPGWELIGNYFQWGRNPQCFAADGSDASSTCSGPVYGVLGPWGYALSSDNAGAIAGWSSSPAAGTDWLDNEKTAADPCPEGFRLPTKAHWEGVMAHNSASVVGTWSMAFTNYSSGRRFGTALMLPAAGYRSSGSGVVINRGSNGNYWSSTAAAGTNSWFLRFLSTNSTVHLTGRNTGFPVRCIAESNSAGAISALDCNSPVNAGNLIAGVPAGAVSSVIAYSGGNGGQHGGQEVQSTGVTGLTATLSAGSFANGNGTLTYTITGTPSGSGMASFALAIGGQSCTLELPVQNPPSEGAIGALNCTGAIHRGILRVGNNAIDIISEVTYTGGNGGPHTGQVIPSTGVTGLTATLVPGNFASGAGSLSYTITGTPSGPGTALFDLSIGGQTCPTNFTNSETQNLSFRGTGPSNNGFSQSAPGLARTVLNTTATNCGAYIANNVWRDFLCHNLGANTLADPFTPGWELVGHYYQWGRTPSCFGSDGTEMNNTCAAPVFGALGPWGYSTSQDNAGEITGWNNNAADEAAWQDGIKSADDPCPAGYRLPTKQQWEGLLTHNSATLFGSWTNASVNYASGRMFGSSLFLPSSGLRSGSNGELSGRGSSGYYWSSTAVAGTKAWYLRLQESGTNLDSLSRNAGASVRCMTDGIINALDCSGASLSGSLVAGAPATGATISLPYLGGNGASHAAAATNSTGVSGLTAALPAGTLATGDGVFTYNLSGTPAASGLALFNLHVAGFSCTVTATVLPSAINAISCSSPVHVGILTAGVPASGVNSTLAYSGGNGGSYSIGPINSTGVEGLTATLPAGNFANGSGNLTFSISGTPSGPGIATFPIQIGGKFCALQRTVAPGADPPIVGSVTPNCNAPVHVGTLAVGAPANDVYSIYAYTGGNGNSYSSQSVNSTGVTGLMATRASGTFANGAGTVIYNISGTPSGIGNAVFTINIGGTPCTLTRAVAPAAITGLHCAQAIKSGSLVSGVPASGVTVSVPYSGGNGGAYGPISVPSSGITGLTATAAGGNFANGSGLISLNITGTPSGMGVAVFNLPIGGQSCALSLTVNGGSIGGLCNGNNTLTGQLVHTVTAQNVFLTVSYTGGNGGPYPGNTVFSSGVEGLVATLAPGFFNIGAGTLTYNISGAPLQVGYANFLLQVGGKICQQSLPVSPGAITGLQCFNATVQGNLVAGVTTPGIDAQVPYVGGNGGWYAGQTVPSQGVTGLTATLESGHFLWFTGGALIYRITGTPSAAGEALFELNIGMQSCTLSVEVDPGLITDLDCLRARHIGKLIAGANTTVVSRVPYTGGNGGLHEGLTEPSGGVTGLTATVPPGNFVVGDDSLTVTITGIPPTTGTASFGLLIGGEFCWLNRPVVQDTIDLLCQSASHQGSLNVGTSAVDVSTQVPYTGGDGGSHGGQSVSSTGVTGLTATLEEGNFANGSGSLTYTITGTPSQSGMAHFLLNIGGDTCTISRTVVGGCGAYVSPGVWKPFMCHNLGAANTNADPFTPSWEINGGYWQWGRIGQAAPGPGGPGAGQANADTIPNWNTTPAPNGAWQDGVKTGNDPCPAGYRVPTQAQWQGVRNSTLNPQSNVGSWFSSVTNYSSGKRFGPGLFLPAAGYRDYDTGALFGRGGSGNYWSSALSGSDYAWFLGFGSGGTGMNYFYFRTDGFSLRCVAE